MTTNNIQYQLTPAGLHRRYLAKRAIQTFKNHYIAGLCSCHPDFPLNLWDKLIPQAVLTLNLLRPARLNPRLSAHAYVHGQFNYADTPIAPPGIKVQAHLRPEERDSWAPHTIDGWYIGPSLEHYRWHRIWIPSTNSERIIQTLTWLPHAINMPTATSTDIAIAVAQDLTHALQQKDANPILPPMNTTTCNALITLANIFNKATNLPSTTPPPTTVPRVPPTATPTTIQHPPHPLPRVQTAPKLSPPTHTTTGQPLTVHGFHTTTETCNCIHKNKPNTSLQLQNHKDEAIANAAQQITLHLLTPSPNFHHQHNNNSTKN
jgi:hypothetical protein